MTCEHFDKVWQDVSTWICEECKFKGNINCRAGCKTQDHRSYSECLLAANIGIDKTSLKP